MKATIKSVNEKTHDWQGQKGTFTFIEGWFESGIRWSFMTKPETASARKAELSALIGKEGEFSGEMKQDNRGEDVFRMKEYPGKSASGGFGGGGGGGRSYQLAWNQTREGELYRTATIQAQVALKAAVDLAVAGKLAEDETVLGVADTYREWLNKVTPAPAEAPKPAEPPAQAPAPAAQDPLAVATRVVKEKIEAMDKSASPDGFRVIIDNLGEIKNRLQARGFNDLLAQLNDAEVRNYNRHDTFVF